VCQLKGHQKVINQLHTSSGGSKGGPGHVRPPPPPRGWPGNIMLQCASIVSRFLVTENGHIWQLHQYCENGLPLENKSQEILHQLDTQKDAKLCLKCIKIRLVAGFCPDPLGELQHSPRLPSCNQGVPTSKGREGRRREGGLPSPPPS